MSCHEHWTHQISIYTSFEGKFRNLNYKDESVHGPESTLDPTNTTLRNVVAAFDGCMHQKGVALRPKAVVAPHSTAYFCALAPAGNDWRERAREGDYAMGEAE